MSGTFNQGSNSAFNPSRRQLLRGDVGARRLPRRLPWSFDEAVFVAGCTRCGACLPACPTAIIETGSGGYPQINFERGECTFCGDCVDACPEPLFRAITEAPWGIRAEIGAGCIVRGNVECRRCGEECEPEAIRFSPQPGRAALPEVSLEDCTGCGACVAVCPTRAITLQLPDSGD